MVSSSPETSALINLITLSSASTLTSVVVPWLNSTSMPAETLILLNFPVSRFCEMILPLPIMEWQELNNNSAMGRRTRKRFMAGVLAKLKKNRRLLGLIDFADWVVPIPTVARSACQCYNVHVSIDYQRGPK